MKNYLKKALAKAQARRSALVTKSDASTDLTEVRNLATQIDEVNGDIADIQAQLDALPPEAPGTEPPAQRTTIVTGAPSAVPTVVTAGAENRTDRYGTQEYRSAFMQYMQTGVMGAELRADTVTALADVAAIIPTTISTEVIKKLTSYGEIFAKVRKLNVKGGVNIPISSLAPTASWIASGSTDRQKMNLSTSVSFSYYGLECKIAIDLIAHTASLDVFESTMIDAMAEAMAQAMDVAIINGTGTNQPTGVTKDSRIKSTQKIAMAPSQFKSWESWKKMVFAKMGKRYKAGSELFMSSGTWEGYIDGMVDTTGQPIARVNYGIGAGTDNRFAGRVVNEVEVDVIADFDDADTGDVVAVIFNPQHYVVNTNMELTSMRWLDPDTNQYVDKMIMVADGKIGDTGSVLIITKAAEPTD